MDKELSPAAQSVLDAYANAPWSDLSGDRLAIAAALRIAVKHAKKEVQPHPAYSEQQFWAFCCGAGRVGDEILALAAELDGGAQ